MEAKEMVEKILKKREVSLYKLAKEIGVTYNTAWMWKKGLTTPLPAFKKILERMLKKH